MPLASVAPTPSFGLPARQESALPGLAWVCLAGAGAVALLCILLLVSMLRTPGDAEALAAAPRGGGQAPPLAPASVGAPEAQAPSPPSEARLPPARPPIRVPPPQAPAAAPPRALPPNSFASAPEPVSPKRTAAPTFLPPSKTESLPWGVKPDPAPSAKWLRRPLELKEGYLQTVLFSRAPATIAVTHSWRNAARASATESKACQHSLDVYDVRKGSHIKTVALEAASNSSDYQLLAFMSDGERALVSRMNRGDHSEWLQVIDLATGKVALEWEPVPGSTFNGLSAAFIDADHVLVAHKDQLTLWELSTQTPTPLASATCFAVSPNGKFIAAGGPERLTFYEAANREPCGELPCHGKPMALAFSATGDRLAAITAGTVTTLECWNLEDGNATADFPVGIKYFFPRGRPPLQWCGKEHVLLDGKWLIDLTRGVAVWRYTASKIFNSPPDESCWYTDHVTIRRKSTEMLCALRLPDPFARQKIERVYSQARQIVAPGSQVTLKLSLPPVPSVPDYVQRVQQLFTDQLAESSITVAEGQPVVLEVSAVQAATGEMHTFKPFFGGQKNAALMQVAGQKVDWRAAISTGGHVYWERTGTSHNVGFMSMAHLKPGETLDQNLTQRMWEGTLFFFKNIGLPSRVFDVADSDGFGESRLNVGGAEAWGMVDRP